MEYKGKLKCWNDDKGFGFISRETQGETDVFLHISELKGMSRRPVDGDIVFYQLYTDASGKTKAVNVRIDGVSFVKPQKRALKPKPEKNSLLGTSLVAAFVIGISLVAYNKLKAKPSEIKQPSVINTSVTQDKPQAIKTPAANYQCDGRNHCSQMTSCEEATFFIKNCPNTEMDGDGDGIPCEEQWCNIVRD